MYTVESKSKLAKLLAVENLTVQHQKLTTAKFDPVNRILYCPIWKEMSSELYDLMLGHEVGHALETPADGWHDSISNKGSKYKHFLNVIEDARIEKKIKRRYPGIRSSFITGYKELLDRDFFGIKSRDLNSLAFIDRLNIYTKSSLLENISFTDEEMVMLNRVLDCETWEDVVSVTDQIYGYSKDEQKTALSVNLYPIVDDEDSDVESYVDEEGSDEDSLEEPEDGESEEAEDVDDHEDSDEEETSNSSGSKKGDDEDEESESVESGEISNDFEPTCETDENFRENEMSLLDEVCKPFVYANLPKFDLNEIVTPYRRVHELLEDVWFKNQLINSREVTAMALVKEFKNRNDRYVSLLAKEFEMRKAAKTFSKSKISTTGDIDIGKIYKYQVEDNIFKKLSRVQKGKSHGLVLLLDRSGSMTDNMAGSIEQILVLAMFCRKVNIPFVVYGFGDNDTGRMLDYPDESRKTCFSQNHNDLKFENVYLREYLNSKMSGAEFNRCFRNLVVLRTVYTGTYRHLFTYPKVEGLSNTPLTQAMLALVPITNNFKRIHNLDLVNLVVVHDGDADYYNTVCGPIENDGDRFYQMNTRFNLERDNVYIKDTEGKFQIKVENLPHHSYNSNDGLRHAVFEFYKHKTGAKIFGFFISGNGKNMPHVLFNKYYDKEGKNVAAISKVDRKYRYARHEVKSNPLIISLMNKIKTDKFVVSHNKGYESMFIMPGGKDLQIEEDELVVTGNVTSNKLKTAFMKMNKNKQVSRIMVSRFIEGIAA